MTRIWTGTLAVLILAAGGVKPAAAGQVVDQSNLQADAGDLQIFGTPAGQSFTPDLAGLDFATFRMAVDVASAGSTPGFASFTVEVREGAGLDGALLGTSQAVVLPDLFAVPGGQDVQFDFADRVALTPGSVYTLVVRPEPGSFHFYELYSSVSDSYAGGQKWFISGGDPNRDYYFIEGINAAAVPEPSTLALAAAGGMTLLAGAWRRRRRA